jgi:hypothetical protein
MTRVAAVIVVLLALPAAADDIYVRKSKLNPSGKPVLGAALKGFDGTKFDFSTGGGVQASGFSPGIPDIHAPVTLPVLDRIEFDGKNDWANVTLKNRDFVRGQAESIKGGFLRLRGVDKPIRMAQVTEIKFTDEPKDLEPGQ